MAETIKTKEQLDQLLGEKQSTTEDDEFVPVNIVTPITSGDVRLQDCCGSSGVGKFKGLDAKTTSQKAFAMSQ